MEPRRLIELIKQSPPIWDRNCPQFRDKEEKEQAWDVVAEKMAVTANACKESFKSLREKYLREREKAQHHAGHYTSWELLDDLRFLDPHIVPRASMWSANSVSEDDISVHSDSDPTDFDKQLIHLVKKASPIWDRNSNTYPNKTSKNQLWENISANLHRDVNSCMLRWKALREKYIRQKAKFQEGEAKWELLDDLAFLDKVIQYRRKQSDFCVSDSGPSSSRYSSRHPLESSEKQDFNYMRCNVDADDYHYATDSSSDFINIVKEESTVQQVADSSYSSCKRSRDNSTSYNDKRARSEENPTASRGGAQKESETKDKTPEQLFGDLVASLLSKKPENQRNLYMIEIMTVLSK